LPIPSHSDTILWLWATNTFLHDAFHLLEAWGFQYHTTLTWAKQGVGLGDWLGGQTEHCLMATKGNYKVFRNNESTLLQADRQKHSEKPDAFYSMVEKLCPGIKADMFARKQREGWYCWGAEANGK
jgi:N6-adenosine-specific RNA methylase IME4